MLGVWISLHCCEFSQADTVRQREQRLGDLESCVQGHLDRRCKPWRDSLQACALQPAPGVSWSQAIFYLCLCLLAHLVEKSASGIY